MMQARSVSADIVAQASSLDAATATAAAIHGRAPVWLRDVEAVRARYPLSAQGLGQMGHSALAVVPLVDRRARDRAERLEGLAAALAGP